MKQTSNRKIRLWACSGLDPSGGAGIAADIAVSRQLNTHCLPLISCLTVQDGRNFHDLAAVDSQLVKRQIESLVKKIPPDVIKLGVLASHDIIEVLAQQFNHHFAETPIFYDPVLSSGGCGAPMVEAEVLKHIRTRILPHCTLVTPNRKEVLALGEDDDIETAARRILDTGCQNVLVSSADTDEQTLTHNWYRTGHNSVRLFHTGRQAKHIHGSGCALCTAIAVNFARENDLAPAIQSALDFVDHAIEYSWLAHSNTHFLP